MIIMVLIETLHRLKPLLIINSFQQIQEEDYNIEQLEEREKAIRQLKKQIKETGILWELSERRFYTKPSAIKRQKNLKAQLRNKKKQQEIDKNY